MRTSIFFLYCCAAISPLIVESSKSSCPIDCEPNGKCVNGECECKYGFAGADCSFPFEQCPDDILTCYDGAQCKRSSLRQDDNMSRSSYECDCSSVPDASPFQIEECESPESEACEEGQLQSDYAFCTNGGKCISMIRHGEPHSGCLCNEEFEGRHCQYRRGEAPHFELKLAYKEKEQSPLVNFLLVVGMGVIAIVFLIVVKKSKQEKEVVVEADAEPSVSLSKEETEDEVEKEVSKGEMA